MGNGGFQTQLYTINPGHFQMGPMTKIYEVKLI